MCHRLKTKLHYFDLLWICCRFVVEQAVQQIESPQQIHNKLKYWNLGLSGLSTYVLSGQEMEMNTLPTHRLPFSNI